MPEVVVGARHDGLEGVVADLVDDGALAHAQVGDGVLVRGLGGLLGVLGLLLQGREHLVPVRELIRGAAGEGYREREHLRVLLARLGVIYRDGELGVVEAGLGQVGLRGVVGVVVPEREGGDIGDKVVDAVRVQHLAVFRVVDVAGAVAAAVFVALYHVVLRAGELHALNIDEGRYRVVEHQVVERQPVELHGVVVHQIGPAVAEGEVALVVELAVIAERISHTPSPRR